MSNKSDQPDKTNALRAEVEARLALSPAPVAALDTSTAAELLHELRVHQIELEMQNEELREAHNAMESARDRYVNLYEFAPVGYITLSREALISEINLTGAALLGVNRTDLINCHFAKFVAPRDVDRWYLLIQNMMAHADVMKHEFDLEMIRADGSTCFVHLDCLRLEAVGAQPVLRLALTDISRLKQAEAELRIAATAFESQEGMLITNADREILRVNSAFTSITGYTTAEVIGKYPNLLHSGRHDADFYAAMWESINCIGFWQGEVWNRRKNGEIYPEHLTITAVKNDEGIVTNYVGTMIDFTANMAAAAAIKKMAFYDPLTGLPNRRLLLDRLKQELASSKRRGQEGALLFIDIDKFKRTNDTLGHSSGDLLLQQIADRLTACVREGDTVARLGGDEFVVMLKDLSAQDIGAVVQTEAVANKILVALNQPHQLATHEYHSTSSIGATLFSGHEEEEELLKQADSAMYRAKQAGGNRLCFFEPRI